MTWKCVLAVAVIAVGFTFTTRVFAEEDTSVPIKDTAPAETNTPSSESGSSPSHAKIVDARDNSIGLAVGGFIVGGMGGLISMAGANTPWIWVGSFASAALFAVGPSVGHYKLGSPVRASITLVARLALGGVGTTLVGEAVAGGLESTTATGYLWSGLACWVVSVIVAVVDLSTFGKYERPAEPRKQSALEITPSVWGGSDTVGIGATATF